jgi:hypothetical protein
MKFFDFRQNNSFGVFRGPARYVVVEAENAADANKRVLYDVEGVYFDGCSEGVDCPCCGDRWYRQWENEVGDDVPSVYGNPVVFGDGGGVLVVYSDGTQKWGREN